MKKVNRTKQSQIFWCQGKIKWCVTKCCPISSDVTWSLLTIHTGNANFIQKMVWIISEVTVHVGSHWSEHLVKLERYSVSMFSTRASALFLLKKKKITFFLGSCWTQAPHLSSFNDIQLNHFYVTKGFCWWTNDHHQTYFSCAINVCCVWLWNSSKSHAVSEEEFLWYAY